MPQDSLPFTYKLLNLLCIVGNIRASQSGTPCSPALAASQNKMRRTALIILSLLVSVVAQSQTAETVLDKYFKAVGTKERWIQLKSKVDKYETKRANKIPDINQSTLNYNSGLFFKVAKRNGTVNLVRYISVQEHNPQDTSTSSFTGTDYWLQFQNGDPVRQMFDLSEIARNSILGHPDKFLNVDNYEYIGVKEIDGVSCEIVRVRTGNTEIDYYFDTVTNYLVLYHGKDKTLKTKLQDYRDVNGLKIPFTEEMSNEFGVISLNHLVDIKIDLIIDNAYFDKLIGDGLVLK